MKVTAITLRPGNVIDHNGKLCVVTKYEIIQPGKGASVMQVEVKDIRTGSKDNIRYRTQETVERLRLEQDDYQFLYADDDGYNFMHNETYEQVSVPGDVIGEPKQFLQEGMIVQIETYEGEPLGAQLPTHVTVEIVEADPVVKGQTASSSYKPAVLANGARVMVPPHIESGTRIVVKTEDGTYVERAKD
ncbi:MAG: elongation factor P [Rhodospirillales bacterium]|nr:elongation factor P [Rhodospirillales bacterium]